MTSTLHGWIAIDKPEGISSARALVHLKRLCKPLKVGHAGTLDPFASGLLLIGIGAATKVISFATDKDKEYKFTIEWGNSTDTQDCTGNIVESSDVRPSREDIDKILKQFCGNQLQTPPVFSAAKIGGKRAYKMARKGDEFTLQPREVSVELLNITNHRENYTTFKIKCSKGFYIRGLARDMASKLGCCGHVSALRRTAIGKFSVENAIPLAKIEKIYHNVRDENLKKLLMPITAVLDDILVLECDEAKALDLLHGRKIGSLEGCPPYGLICCVTNTRPIALCRVSDGVIHPLKVFNYN